MIYRSIGIAVLTVCLANTSAAQTCTGDCSEDGRVTVNELVQAVNIALDRAAVETCSSVDADGNQQVTVNEVVLAVNNLLQDCNDATPMPSPTATPSGDDQLPPTMNAELIAWLQAGRYRGWASEGQHPGSGPHFGAVRTFVNDALLDSLDAGGETHGADAAAVKELFGSSGSTVRGWAVSVKVEDGTTGNQWYWFEYYNGNVVASGIGNGICTGCHGGGTDYVCTPYPLQPGGQTVPARCP
jgi:hypothetical protein